MSCKISRLADENTIRHIILMHVSLTVRSRASRQLLSNQTTWSASNTLHNLEHQTLTLTELRGESSAVVNRQQVDSSGIFLEPASGIEPPTCGLRIRVNPLPLLYFPIFSLQTTAN